MRTLTQLDALMLLNQCHGDEIWSAEYCQQCNVPPTWVEELADCYESGFRFDRDTIYVANRPVTQYYGVKDRDLAFKLAEFLGVDTARVAALALGRAAEVQALQESVDEG